MKPTTLCFPVDPAGRLLLGCKKRGFGAGKWNGFGGKLEGKETFRSCAVREVREEAGIRINPDDLDLIGFLDFHFSKKPEDDHITYIYMTETWQGEPVESEEMKPAFFLPEEIPYDHMWQGDLIWVPRLLQGEKVKGQVTFDDDGETVKHMELFNL